MKRLLYSIAFATALLARAEATKAGAQPSPAAQVNWEGQVIKATGSGAPDLTASTPAQARLGAEMAAKMDAFRNLLAQVKGIRVSAGKTVGDEMAKDEVRGRVEGVIRGYKVTGKRYFSDGGVEVDVEVPLSAIASLFAPADEAQAAKEEEAKPADESGATGLIVDARGLKVTPALQPRLLDESGKALYSVEVLGAEARKRGPVLAYVKDVDQAKKTAGDRPVIVKATKADGTDLTLHAEDLKAIAQGSKALTEGRVAVVIN